MAKLRNRLSVLIAEYEVKHNARLTHQELSRLTGVTREIISKMVNGNTSINHSTIEKLCNFFDCQPGDLLFMERDKELA